MSIGLITHSLQNLLTSAFTESSPNMKIRMYLALGTLVSMAHMILPATACTQGRDCLLPDCFCSTFDHPDFTNVKDIPQMVYFAFDDALNVDVSNLTAV